MLSSILLWLIFTPIWYVIMPKALSINIPFYVHNTYGQMNTRLLEVDSLSNIDGLILGSSHAYRGLDTRIFKNYGHNVFNLGSSSQTPIQSEYLYNKYYVQLNPKWVIIEVDPFSLSSDGVESSIDIIPKSKFDAQKLYFASQVPNIKVWNLILINMVYSAFGYYDQSFKDDNPLDGDLYVEGGFVEKLNYDKVSVGSVFPKRIVPLNNVQIHALKRLAETIQREGRRLILVQSPIRKSYYDSVELEVDYDSLMHSISPEFLNFNELEFFEDAFFYDDHHLNQLGVDKFNESLLLKLKNLSND